MKTCTGRSFPMSPIRTLANSMALLGMLLATACSSDPSGGGGGGGSGGGGGGSGGGSGDPNAPDAAPPLADWQVALNARQVNYGQALRTASIKLVGDLPTMDELNAVISAADPSVPYAAQIDKYLADPRFSTQMQSFWRDTFKMGGTVNAMNLDTAPNFAAQLVVENRSYMELFNATTNTCPTL